MNCLNVPTVFRDTIYYSGSRNPVELMAYVKNYLREKWPLYLVYIEYMQIERGLPKCDYGQTIYIKYMIVQDDCDPTNVNGVIFDN
jgi:hypothetical protein